VKSGTRDDPSQVQILVVTADSGVSICAVNSGFSAGQAGNCGSQSTSLFTSDVQVVFTVQVPAGVALDIGTVNGDIRASGLTGDIRATTVNGSIDATIPVSANVVVHTAAVGGTISTDFLLSVRGSSGFFCGSESTLNGTLGSGGRDLKLTTVNGSIHLRELQ
jgi:hypothetical protein